jgi:Uma2 family endonuclease
MAMPADTFPQHPGVWTLDEVLALPDDQGSRVELVDGTVIVSPAPTSRHQRVLHRLQVGWDQAVPPDCELLPGVNVVLNGARLLIPDLAVVTEPGADTAYYKGDELLMAVEIHSPSTRAYDRALKRQLYQEAGVPFLVLVDPGTGPYSAICLELDGDEYRESARAQDGWLTLERPFSVTVDLAGSGH